MMAAAAGPNTSNFAQSSAFADAVQRARQVLITIMHSPTFTWDSRSWIIYMSREISACLLREVLKASRGETDLAAAAASRCSEFHRFFPPHADFGHEHPPSVCKWVSPWH